MGLVLMGRAMFSKSLIQFSVDGWGCVPSLLFNQAQIKDFPVAQMVKKLPVMPETRVQSLGWEVPLEKGMAIQSSIFEWIIPWTEKSGGLQSMGSQRVGHD